MNDPKVKEKIPLTAAQRKERSRANRSEEAAEKERERNRKDKTTPKAMEKTRERMKAIHKAKMEEKERREKFPQAPELKFVGMNDHCIGVGFHPTVYMSISVNCFPRCTFTWFKDGEEIQEPKGKISISDRWDFKTIDGIQRRAAGTLKIIRPNTTDSGIYLVRVTNEHGEMEYSFQVEMIPKEGKGWRLKEPVTYTKVSYNICKNSAPK